ncbi:MAG TPA: phage tail protein, partial [Novosphingobium sp.]|nr:phage tail protein [Novosphingobium sp.]
ADYGNRIPSLTFEVFADSGTLTLASLFEGWLEDVDADVPLTGIAGYSSDGAFNATLSQFQPVFPMDCDAGGSGLTLSRQRLQSAPIALGEPAVAAGNQGNFGGKHGFSRKLAPVTENPPRILRYYDIALDYQPGSQRAPGQPLPGQPKSIDLPAAITALNAFGLIAQTARNTNWARQTIAWRCAQLDPAVAPGAVVSLPDKAGQWRVTEWEWRDTGIELALERLAPTAGTSAAVYAGAASLAADVAVGASALFAYELPWDGTGSNAQTLIQAAVSSASSGWAGAAILVDDEAGALTQISASGRLRSTIGTTQGALPAASPLFFDRASTLDVQLLASDMALAGATARQLVTGANRALVGAEIIQFAGAAALGGGVWQLSGLLRGRGGTEAAIAGHAAGEPFVLLDSLPVTLDSSQIGADARIAALGLGDASAVEADIVNRGIGLKPLAPVHPNAVANADGSLTLGWTRRARGAWLWLDGVDVALQEESEAYIVCYGPLAAPLAMWSTPAAQLNLGASTLATLRGQLANGPFYVRQQGTSGLSTALFLATLS